MGGILRIEAKAHALNTRGDVSHHVWHGLQQGRGIVWVMPGNRL
jgi:hypothetical protein